MDNHLRDDNAQVQNLCILSNSLLFPGLLTAGDRVEYSDGGDRVEYSDGGGLGGVF